MFMRTASLALVALLATISVTTSLKGQRADAPVDPRSMQLLAEGRAQRAAGQLDAATDTVETALTVDPRNRAAFVTLAEIAQQRGLPGKAIRLYREALTLEPDDRSALQGQGEALVAKGALDRARANLARLKTLCKGDCPEANRLAAAITKGPPVTTAQVEAGATGQP
jgi:Tfp pilus assembly protein PilF